MVKAWALTHEGPSSIPTSATVRWGDKYKVTDDSYQKDETLYLVSCLHIDMPGCVYELAPQK